LRFAIPFTAGTLGFDPLNLLPENPAEREIMQVGLPASLPAGCCPCCVPAQANLPQPA